MNVVTAEKATGTDLVIARPITPAIFANPESVSEVLAELERQVEAAKASRDISTPEGRAAIASLAYKIARTKTGLDDMGKNVVADWKAKANMVDAERRRIRDRCDELKDDFRKPLTDWERKEEERVEAHQQALQEVRAFTAAAECCGSSAQVMELLERLYATHAKRDWQEFADRAREAIDATTYRLRQVFDTMKADELAAAEAERQRQEQQERERQQRELAARQAREEQERRQREHDERLAAERTVREREQREAHDREERLKREAEENERRLAEAERRAQEAADKAKREIEAQQAAEAEAQRKREENRRIKARVNKLVMECLVREVKVDGKPISEELAKAVVVALAMKKIPHVRIEY